MTVSFNSGEPPENKETPDLQAEGTSKAFGGANTKNTSSVVRPHALQGSRHNAHVAVSEETLIDRVVSNYLLSIAGADVSLVEIRDTLISQINSEFALENEARRAIKDADGNIIRQASTSPAIPKVRFLDELTVVRVLLARQHIISVDLAEGGEDDMTLLAMYCDMGDEEGTYVTSEDRLALLASELKPSMTTNPIKSLLKRLRTHAPKVQRTLDPQLIPVGNGVFHHGRQELLPFSPDWVFLSKIPHPYDPHATNTSITMRDGLTWDVEQWIADLSDDDGVPELLWELIGAAVRSLHHWDKSAWFQAERGNNGKGTYAELLRNLLGGKACSSVKFGDFGHEFKMEPLIHSRANIVDENAVGSFSDKVDTWKAAVTGDVFQINRKYKDPVAVRFHGIDIQCFNSRTPRTKDRSESFYRRLIIVPFNKWFGGAERKYIKHDYIARPEVLRYVLRRALEMTHEELSVPLVCAEALNEYRGTNNPLQAFWEEFKDQFVWGLLPFRFLHELYTEWFRRTNPSGQAESQDRLIAFLREHLAGSPEWEHKGSADVRPGKRMTAPEPLIAAYELRNWYPKTYSGSDLVRLSTMDTFSVNYKGLKRLPGAGVAAAPNEDAED